MTLDDLIAYGANVDEGLGRCMNNEGFYLRLVETVKAEGGFAKLKDSIESNDLDQAFEAAHSLKGVTANLALTPIYEPVNEITELLRAKSQVDYTPLLTEILDQYDKFCAL